MQPQEYTIKEWKPWLDQETGEVVKDLHSNHKGSVLFDEDSAEPIDATFKPPIQPGQKKYGIVDMYTTKKGSVRKGFTRRDRPQDNQQSFGSKKEWQPRDDAAIQAQWAIGKSIDLGHFKEFKDFDTEIMAYIENRAKKLFAMISRVKFSGSQITESQPLVATTPGYDKAKAAAEAYRTREKDEALKSESEPLPEPPEEIRFDQEGEPVNLSDIPF